MVSDGVINIVSGEADFVSKTMTFKVSQLIISGEKKGGIRPLGRHCTEV